MLLPALIPAPAPALTAAIFPDALPAAAWIPAALVAAEALARLALGVRVIMRRTSVPLTMAWLLLLFFVPVVSIAAYALIGEPRLGRSRAARYERLTAGIEADAVQLWRSHHAVEPHAGAFQHLARLGTAISGLPALGGNSLRLIGDTDEFLSSLVADIDAATDHCHLLTFIWTPGGGPSAVADALARAAGRGVECRVLADAVGSGDFLSSDDARRLRRAGVRVVAALPVNPVRMLLARVDLRNHRKIAVIDGRVGYMGSHNLTDRGFKLDRKRGIGPWIDASVRAEGPAAQALQAVFLRDWQLDSDEAVGDLGRFMPALGSPAEGSAVHVLPSGPGRRPESLQHAVLSVIHTARDEILLTTPYFVPDEATKSALRTAAERGVDTTVIIPARVDSRLVSAAGRSHHLDLLESGVKILRYRRGLLHAKTITIDRRLGIIGSHNFDMRSFWLNFEVTMLIYDDDFASVLRFMQRDYAQHADEIERSDLLRRSWPRRFADNLAQLAGPLL